jgi:hypothetical protein
MFWGKSTAVDSSNGSAVFDTSNSFTGVWHLEDTASLSDATIRSNTATNNGADAISGILGNAVDFNVPDSENVTIPTGALTGVSGNITISLWAFGENSIPEWANSIISCIDASSNTLLNAHLPWDDGIMYWDFGNSGGWERISKSSTTTEQKGQWNHWVFTHNSSTGYMRQYLNGTEWNSGTGKNKTLGTPSVFKLGSTATNEYYYDGSIDEFTISKTERSADWIKLSHANQQDEQTLVSFDGDTTTPVPDDYTTWAYSTEPLIQRHQELVTALYGLMTSIQPTALKPLFCQQDSPVQQSGIFHVHAKSPTLIKTACSILSQQMTAVMFMRGSWIPGR